MAKKQKCPPPGAPDWMVTFSDMTTLLLCFFVLIIAFSEIKKEDEFQAVVEEVKKAFGMKGGGGRLPTDDDPELTLIQRLEALNLQRQKMEHESNTDDPGVEGRERETQVIRPGMLIVLGGPIYFEHGSKNLTPEAKKQLAFIADQTRGNNNLIEIQGHCAAMEKSNLPPQYKNLWQLSYERASTVLEYLTSDEIGLKPNRFRVVSNADREPVVSRVYTADEQKQNRRVIVSVSESIVRDYTKPIALGN